MGWSGYILGSELLQNSHHVVAFVCAGAALLAFAFTAFLCVAHFGFLCAGITTRQFWLEAYQVAVGETVILLTPPVYPY